MEKRKVYISAVGLIKAGEDSKSDRFLRIRQEQYEDILNGLPLRNVDRISKMALAAAKQALYFREQDIPKDKTKDLGIILGTQYSSLNSIHEFDKVSVEKGALGVNPGLFPNTVLNSPACQVEIQLGAAGPCYTICNKLTSALDAIGAAYINIMTEMASIVLAGGADEITELQSIMHQTSRRIGEAAGFAVMEDGKQQPDGGFTAEVAGYKTLSFNECETAQLSGYGAAAVADAMRTAGVTTDRIGHISFDIYLSQNESRQLAEDICSRLNYKGEYEYLDIDWMGAGGIVQTASAVEALREEETAVWILVGIDRDSTSVVVLSPCR